MNRPPIEQPNQVKAGDPLLASQWNAMVAKIGAGGAKPNSSRQRTFTCSNIAEVMPPYSCFSFESAGTNSVLEPDVVPNKGPGVALFTNGSQAIAANSTGRVHSLSRWAPVLLASDGTPTPGTLCGPVADQWDVRAAGGGLLCLSAPDALQRVWCLPVGGTLVPRYKVITELAPAPGDGSQIQTGSVDRIVDDAGTLEGNPQPIWTEYSARIPPGVVGHMTIRPDGDYELLTANCDLTVQPLESPITTQTNPYTAVEGDATLIIQ